MESGQARTETKTLPVMKEDAIKLKPRWPRLKPELPSHQTLELNSCFDWQWLRFLANRNIPVLFTNRCQLKTAVTLYTSDDSQVLFSATPRMVCPKLCAKLVVFPWCSYIGPVSKPVRLFTLKKFCRKKCSSNMLMLTTSNAQVIQSDDLISFAYDEKKEKETTHDIILNNKHGYQHAGIIKPFPKPWTPPKF